MKRSIIATTLLGASLTVAGFIFGVAVGRVRGIPFTESFGGYSIGILKGTNPAELSEVGIANPAISMDMITDVSAVGVADPFMAHYDNGWCMLFEVLNGETSHGDIGLAVSRNGIKWDYQHIVLDEKYSVSYPCFFESQGEWFLIPETAGAKAVRLYKAIDFPQKWEFIRTLVANVEYYDPTTFYYNNKWWMFASVSNHELLLLYSDSLTGTWVQHPLSPIRIDDFRDSRSAGRSADFSTMPLRFSQNCTTVYGQEVHAHKVTALSESLFAEIPLAPQPFLAGSGRGWNAQRMHHIDLHQESGGSWMACVDGLGYYRKFGIEF